MVGLLVRTSPKGMFFFSAMPLSPTAEGFRFQSWARSTKHGRSGTPLTPHRCSGTTMGSSQAFKWGRGDRLWRKDCLTEMLDTCTTIPSHRQHTASEVPDTYVSQFQPDLGFYRIPCYTSENSCAEYLLTSYPSTQSTAILCCIPPRV